MKLFLMGPHAAQLLTTLVVWSRTSRWTHTLAHHCILFILVVFPCVVFCWWPPSRAGYKYGARHRPAVRHRRATPTRRVHRRWHRRDLPPLQLLPERPCSARVRRLDLYQRVGTRCGVRAAENDAGGPVVRLDTLCVWGSLSLLLCPDLPPRLHVSNNVVQLITIAEILRARCSLLLGWVSIHLSTRSHRWNAVTLKTSSCRSLIEWWT